MQPNQTLSSENPQIRYYKALLTQSGTDAPTVTILQNTLTGTPVWTRDALGYYLATLENQFNTQKTIIKPFGNNQLAMSFIALGSATPLEYCYTITNPTNDTIQLEVYKSSDYSSAELSSILQIGYSTILIDIEVHN